MKYVIRRISKIEEPALLHKAYIHFTILVLLTISGCLKQDSKFTIANRTYIEIKNSSTVNDSIVWGKFNHTFRIPIGFSYEFLNHTFDSLDIETTGRLVFDKKHLFFADAFTEISLQDLGFTKGISHSPITYKNEGSEQDKVLVIQFKNASFANDSLSTINFQIRLYENENFFELHIGPSKINNFSLAFENGPFSGINKVKSFNPFILDYRLAIHGNTLTPLVTFDSGEGLNPFEYKLTDVPVEGTVYKFRTTLPHN